MAGKIHRHTYEDDSGKCCRCKKEHSPHVFEQSICITCGMTCNHTWNSLTGECTLCKVSCEHDRNASGECNICGMGCPHGTWDPNLGNPYHHTCAVCGKWISHVFETTGLSSICRVCGYRCPHSWYDRNGYHRCRYCGVEERHSPTYKWYSDFYCKCEGCNLLFDHECYNTTSTNCGTCYHCRRDLGRHSFGDGWCAKCNYICLHPSVSNNVCNICGMTVDTE